MAKKKVDKPRNAGSMTESAFWSMIRSTLRRRSMFWKPVQQVKKEASRPYTGENKRIKFEYQCSICGEWHFGKDIEVDHIIPAGTLTCAEDLPSFVEKLFCEKDGLRVLCSDCHSTITNIQKKRK